MRADEVEVSWDPGKKKWLLRIRIGEEVVRRYCEAPESAERETLKSLVRQTLQDEGYESEPVELTMPG